uniref:Uncharacterized protein n=1 Tax=Panagrolaimus superbus TaxID=310955 RepID=A0A914Z1D1_9BILA
MISRNQRTYQINLNDTVEDLVNNVRSANEWPENAEINVLLKRYVDNKARYNAVNDSFTLTGDDTIELNVNYSEVQSVIDNDSTHGYSNDLSSTSYSSNNSATENNDTINDETTCEQFYDKYKDQVNVFMNH